MSGLLSERSTREKRRRWAKAENARKRLAEAYGPARYTDVSIDQLFRETFISGWAVEYATANLAERCDPKAVRRP